MLHEVMMVVAVVIGIVVGIAGTLLVSRIRRSSSDRGKPPVLNPAKVGIRRSSKKTGVMTEATADGVPGEQKKRRGRPAKDLVAIKKSTERPKAQEGIKRGPGRPRKKDVAMRQSDTALTASVATVEGHRLATETVSVEHQVLIDRLLLLSQDELRALADMPVQVADSSSP